MTIVAIKRWVVAAYLSTSPGHLKPPARCFEGVHNQNGKIIGHQRLRPSKPRSTTVLTTLAEHIRSPIRLNWGHRRASWVHVPHRKMLYCHLIKLIV